MVANFNTISKLFPSKDSCIAFLETIKWNNKPQCPYCNSTNFTSIKGEHRYRCNNCYTSYSVTVKTLFHKTKIDYQKWFFAIILFLNIEQKISARQLAGLLNIDKNTAWYMTKRIQKASRENRDFLLAISNIACLQDNIKETLIDKKGKMHNE
jgi:transposase-like protein